MHGSGAGDVSRSPGFGCRLKAAAAGGGGPGSPPPPGALCPHPSPRHRLLKGPRGVRSRAGTPPPGRPLSPSPRPHPETLRLVAHTPAEGPVVRVPSTRFLSPPAWPELAPPPLPAAFVRAGPAAGRALLSPGPGTSAHCEPGPARRFTCGIRASPLHDPWRWEPGSVFYLGGNEKLRGEKVCLRSHVS